MSSKIQQPSFDEKSPADVREEWIRSAEVILGLGKGHMGVIGFLQSKGLPPEKAKAVSYDIFDEAKRRIMKSQRWYRLLARILIIMGFVTMVGGVILFWLRAAFIGGIPMIGGVMLLGKLVNPSRLPEDPKESKS
ncbi:MAG: hypothetical protein PVJ98_09840 [Akkermansiaceae bacterium]|jgi:hypothetical protein